MRSTNTRTRMSPSSWKNCFSKDILRPSILRVRSAGTFNSSF
jgi:hypothetical protein